jgi:hypothetical protein
MYMRLGLEVMAISAPHLILLYYLHYRLHHRLVAPLHTRRGGPGSYSRGAKARAREHHRRGSGEGAGRARGRRPRGEPGGEAHAVASAPAPPPADADHLVQLRRCCLLDPNSVSAFPPLARRSNVGAGKAPRANLPTANSPPCEPRAAKAPLGQRSSSEQQIRCNTGTALLCNGHGPHRRGV